MKAGKIIKTKNGGTLTKISAAAVFLALFLAICLAITVLYKNHQTSAPSDYVIENGILKKYVGDDLNVIIPENVTKISSFAFENSSKVQTLELGSHVSDIEQLSFSPLSSLQKITVDPGNNIFEVIDDVLIKKDGTFVFASIEANRGRNADEIMMDVFEIMKKNDFSLKSLEKIEIGKAVLYCDSVENEYHAYPYVKSIEVFGQIISFEKERLRLYGNLKFQAFESDGCFALASVDNSGSGEAVIITEKDVVKIETPMNDSDREYNRSVITFFEENGRLSYERIPRKYYNIQAAGGVFGKCVSADELYKETGYAEVKDGNMLYYPQSVLTVSQGFELESEYKSWGETIGKNLPPMDEYLENNKKVYDAAK